MIKVIFIALLLLIIFFVYYKKESFSANNNKKIALCFLIYDKINHEDIWYKWLKNVDKSNYNIYIHYKEDKKLKYFNNHKLSNCIPTDWCSASIVESHLLLLDQAIKDKNNRHFIFISNSCLPVKSFNYIYNNLNIDKSYFNKGIYMGNDLEPNIANKASQWCILNRKHTELLVNNKKTVRKTYKSFQNINGCPDEYCIISSLKSLNKDKDLIITDNLSVDATTFTGWPDMKNYRKFDKSILTKETPNSYSYICPEELEYLVKSKSLFGRKFEENCGGLDNLLKMINE